MTDSIPKMYQPGKIYNIGDEFEYLNRYYRAFRCNRDWYCGEGIPCDLHHDGSECGYEGMSSSPCHDNVRFKDITEEVTERKKNILKRNFQ